MDNFSLVADVATAQPVAIRAALSNLVEGTVTPTPNGFHVEGQASGEDPQDANRQLFNSLRRIEPRTTLRSQLTFDGTVHRFVDLQAQGTFAVTSG
ncbi:MAG: hypothetical protein ACRDVC_03960 [Acidimicrobiales bacterium]